MRNTSLGARTWILSGTFGGVTSSAWARCGSAMVNARPSAAMHAAARIRPWSCELLCFIMISVSLTRTGGGEIPACVFVVDFDLVGRLAGEFFSRVPITKRLKSTYERG